MKRVAIIADSHWDECSRWDECCRLHEWIENDIAERGIDMVIHTGDVFERKNSPKERNKVAEWLCDVARTAPILIVRGNHDAIGDLAIYSQLEAKNPIEVVETYGVRYRNGINVAALAWPRKAHVLAGTDAGHEASEQMAAEALRNVLRGMGAELAQRQGPKILAAHAMVSGSVTSHGQPLVGCDFELGIGDLALAGADFVALGHIHKGQEWSYGGVPIVYPGSPRRTAYGEVEEKGYVVATFDADNACTWERVPVPATKMVLIEATWDADTSALVTIGETLPERDMVRGAEVRLRYRTPSDARDVARRMAFAQRDAMIGSGAVSVKVEEEVIATTRARVPEIAKAATTRGKLEAMWRARDAAPEPARAERIFAKLAQIEEGS